MTTIVARPGTFVAAALPRIGPEIFEEEMEFRRLKPLILQIMRESERFTTVAAESKDLPGMLRDYASVLRSFETVGAE